MNENDRGPAGAAGKLVVPAVSLFVLRGDRLLAMKRSMRKDAMPGAWEVVSGRVEPGEQPYDAAVRECREETGLAVTPEPRPTSAYTTQRAGRPMLVVGYRAHSESGDVVISDEHDDFAWMTIDEFAGACPFPGLVEVARRVMARGGEALAPHIIMWQFEVRAGSEAAFEAAYGPDGDWARLFRKASGYLGTELLRTDAVDGERPRYVTLDRWESRAAFEAFRDAHHDEYDALDDRCEDLTVDETPLGSFVPALLRPSGGSRIPP